MELVLSKITKYINTCSTCPMGIEAKCGFIVPDIPPTPENNPYDHKEYRDLTYEQRAFRKEGNVTRPCDDQKTFATLIDEIEAELEPVAIGFTSHTLLKFLTKISNIEKSIRRQDEHILFAFEDIVMTCLERCLAHIDYGFLEARIDIEEAIHSIFPDYKRKEALCLAHPEAFVNTYLSQATKISL